VEACQSIALISLCRLLFNDKLVKILVGEVDDVTWCTWLDCLTCTRSLLLQEESDMELTCSRSCTCFFIKGAFEIAIS
jgi:hypothetical protein